MPLLHTKHYFAILVIIVVHKFITTYACWLFPFWIPPHSSHQTTGKVETDVFRDLAAMISITVPDRALDLLGNNRNYNSIACDPLSTLVFEKLTRSVYWALPKHSVSSWAHCFTVFRIHSRTSGKYIWPTWWVTLIIATISVLMPMSYISVLLWHHVWKDNWRNNNLFWWECMAVITWDSRPYHVINAWGWSIFRLGFPLRILETPS